MRRSSRYHPLQWVVEVQWPGSPTWEPMAAFNHDRVAGRYADECVAGTTPINGEPFRYRVVERDGRGKFDVIHKASGPAQK